MKTDSTAGQNTSMGNGYKFPKNKKEFAAQIEQTSERSYYQGIEAGKKIATNQQVFEITQAKIAIMHEAAALAAANAKLTYALSQIVGEKKGFGA